jgi:hypothetical protein
MPAAYNEPQEEQYTEWFNPLDEPQKVDVYVGNDKKPTRYVVPPGGTKLIPSRYDRAIHTVHNGVIIAGLAPQLVKVASRGKPVPEEERPKLDPALDPNLQKKKEAEAKQREAEAAKRAAEDAAAVARVTALDADTKVAEAKTATKRATPKPEQG